jgi:hypothetical protein
MPNSYRSACHAPRRHVDPRRRTDLGAKAARPNGRRSAAGAESSQVMANHRVDRPGPPRDLGRREHSDQRRPAGSQS